MIKLESLFLKAESSKFWLACLNKILLFVVPFNRPHGIRLRSVSKSEVSAELPYRRKNQNHIGGLHACGLATVAEFVAGVLLLHNLSSARFRLIMKEIQVSYHSQGRLNAIATSQIDPASFAAEVISELENSGEVNYQTTTEIKDISGKHLCSALVTWQLKNWDKVRKNN